MLELQPADAGGIADLHIEVVVVLVVRINNADAEGLRITERAKIDAVDVDVAEDLHPAFPAEEGVGFQEPLREASHFVLRVSDGFPEGVFPVAVK